MIAKLLLILSACLMKSLQSRMTLLNVNVIVRNGNASPRENLLDLSGEESPIGNISFNSLTGAGKRQMLVLGEALAKAHINVTQRALKNDQVHIRALNNLPYTMSAWALSLALFPDKFNITNVLTTKMKPQFPGQSLKTRFDSPLPGGYSLIPVRYTAFDTKDYLFLLSSKNTCPNINTQRVRNEINRLSEKFPYQASYDKVAAALKFNPENHNIDGNSKLYLASRLFEYLEAINSVSTAPAFSNSTQEYIDLKRAYNAYIVSTVFSNESLGMLNSPIINVVLASMAETIAEDKAFLNSSLSKAHRYGVFVGHDKFIVALLRFLGIYDGQCAYDFYFNTSTPKKYCVAFPEPGSSIEFRLYRKDPEDSEAFWEYEPTYFIQIYYNGRLKNLKSRTQREGSAIDWENFKNFLRDKITPNWEVECGLGSSFTPQSNDTRLLVLIASNIVIFFFMALGCYFAYWRGQKIIRDRKSSVEIRQDDENILDKELKNN